MTAVSKFRREKRRHASSVGAEDIGDPLQLLNLAVRVDETSSLRNNIALLEEPMEQGRLYNTQDFTKAVEYLKAITAAPPTKSTRRRPSMGITVRLLDWLFSSSHATNRYLGVAITPIILSGLIAAQRQREAEQSPDATVLPSTSELMTQCAAMRRAAIQRLKWEKKRRKLQRLLCCVVLVLFCGIAYKRSMASIRESITELGYVGVFPQGASSSDTPLLPCASSVFSLDDSSTKEQNKNNNNKESTDRLKWFRSMIPGSASPPADLQVHQLGHDVESQVFLRKTGWAGYRDACFASEANLWAHFRDYACTYNKPVRTCNSPKCDADFRSRIQRHLSNIPGRGVITPYSMHTAMERNVHMLTGNRALRETLKMYQLHPSVSTQEEDFDNECDQVNKDIIWLGDSAVHGLIRKLLEREFQIGSGTATREPPRGGEPIRILDVGCGVGGLSYALSSCMGFVQDDLPESCWEKRSSPSPQFRYHGISISAAEVLHAKRLADDHGMDLSKVSYDQMSFDDPALGNSVYSAAIAVESLVYSQNLNVTLSSLARTLMSGGTLAVVNDVSSGLGSNGVADELISSGQKSLLTHSQWLRHLEEAGFVVEEAIDLGLHFDLPQLLSERETRVIFYKLFKWFRRQLSWGDPFLQANNNEKPFTDKLLNWLNAQYMKVDPLTKFLQRWEDWIGPTVASDYLDTMSLLNAYPSYDQADLLSLAQKFASLRVVQVFQGHMDWSGRESQRKAAHRSGDLTYNMYICRKQ